MDPADSFRFRNGNCADPIERILCFPRSDRSNQEVLESQVLHYDPNCRLWIDYRHPHLLRKEAVGLPLWAYNWVHSINLDCNCCKSCDWHLSIQPSCLTCPVLCQEEAGSFSLADAVAHRFQHLYNLMECPLDIPEHDLQDHYYHPVCLDSVRAFDYRHLHTLRGSVRLHHFPADDTPNRLHH